MDRPAARQSDSRSREQDAPELARPGQLGLRSAAMQLALQQAFEAYGQPPAESWRQLQALIQPKRLEPGQSWQRAGETPRAIALLSSGLLRMFYLRSDGREFNKAFIRSGQWVGALDALVVDEPSRITIQALRASELLTLSYPEFDALCDRDLYWSRFARKLVERTYVVKVRREASLLLDSAEQRYRSFLRDYADVENDIADYQIASYLGITPVALSRIKKRLHQGRSGAGRNRSG